MASTICAISTPLGTGGIGVIRISGSEARQIADRVFTSVSGKKIADAKGYTALFGNTHDKKSAIDETVALVFAAPKSYTGEDVVELSVHGGTYILKKLLRAVLSAGATLAGPGEFTERAFMNGKLDLIEAESVMSLIGSVGEQDLRLAQGAKSGKTSRLIAEVKDSLLRVDAELSVFADYPDEDLPELKMENLQSNLNGVKDRLSLILDDYDSGRLVREGISTVIVGTPNVGKSTLMNLLSGDKRSIVTEVAGTTRDIIEDTVRIGDITLKLADTAGIHDSADEVESIGIALAKERIDSAELVIAVFDRSRPFSEDDRKLLSLAKSRPFIAVINKSDMEKRLDTDAFDGVETVEMSAKNGDGLELLQNAVLTVTGLKNLDPDRAVLSSERQRDCAKRAFDSIGEAVTALKDGYTLDAVGICADEALSALLELTGERVTEAVTREVFSRFCVGK